MPKIRTRMKCRKKQAKANSLAPTVQIRITWTCTAVEMKLYDRHMLHIVTNTT